MYRQKLLADIATLEARCAELVARYDDITVDDAGELRSLTEDEAGEVRKLDAELVEANAELKRTRETLAALDETAARRAEARTAQTTGTAGNGDWTAEFRAGTEDRTIASNGAVTVSSNFNAEPIADVRQATHLHELFAVEDEPTGVYSGTRQTVRTNNAAAVADYAVKPESVYTLTAITGRTKTLAHLSEPIPLRWLEANDRLRVFVEDELRHGLNVVTDTQVASGSGVGENMTGLLVDSGVGTITFATNFTTTSRRALTYFQKLGVPAAQLAYVVHPDLWETVDLAAGAEPIVTAAPISRSEQLLHGVPVMLSTAAASPLLLARNAAKIKRTGGVRIEWSSASVAEVTEGEFASDFQRNLVRARCECLADLLIERPTLVRKIATA